MGAATIATTEHAIFARRPTPTPYSSLVPYLRRNHSFYGEDRISLLGDELLSNIVARLPVKDVVRTTVLSTV